jgi:hypothetical protein
VKGGREPNAEKDKDQTPARHLYPDLGHGNGAATGIRGVRAAIGSTTHGHRVLAELTKETKYLDKS